MMDRAFQAVYICVFCGSSNGAHPAYRAEAAHLGTLLAARRFGLVYGGASVGLMGALADSALSGGAPVVGVLPAVLKDREIAHPGLTELLYVATMHQRKALMADHAHAFLALPGGFGTLDEFLEILTWSQLGLHAKPCLLINTRGYFDGLLQFLDHAVAEGFIRNQHRATLQVAPDAETALNHIERALPSR